MFNQRLLDKELAVAGVPRVANLTYAPVGRHSALSWTLTFRLLGAYRWEVDGALKVSHAVATPFARRCLSEFAGKWWADAVARQPEIGSGVGFPVSNLTNWSQSHSLTIKDLTAQQSASRIASDVRLHVLPFVVSVQDDNTYLEHILADTMPMKWLYSQPLARFAEAVKLSVICDRGLQAARQALDRERAFAMGQLGDFELDEYVASVIRAAGDA